LIKRILVLSAVALATCITAASAASTPNFSGFYIGAHAGYGWEDVTYSGPNATLSFDPDGFVGGAHGGYNWQWDGWVAGLEGNFDYVDGDESDTFGVVDTFEANWEAAVRARVGAYWEDYLIYGAVGVSWLDYDWTKGGSSTSDTTTGWTWGVGVEKQITSSLRARVEYRAGEYDDEHLEFPGSDRDVDPDTQAVTLGLSFALN
jgi:outer membrane immunogenic protein